MEFTREMLKDQLHLCKIQNKTFHVLELFQVNDMIKNFMKNLLEKKPTHKSFKIKSFLAARAARTARTAK
jgi:hypothetical protein